MVSRDAISDSFEVAPSDVVREKGGGLNTLVRLLIYCESGSSPSVVPGEVLVRIGGPGRIASIDGLRFWLRLGLPEDMRELVRWEVLGLLSKLGRMFRSS